MRLKMLWYPAGLIAVVGGGCTGVIPSAGTPIVLDHAPSQTINIAVGQELDITLGTLGPGGYDTPGISSPIVQLLDEAVVPPYTPGGPTQRFRFLAQATGQAIVTLGQSGRPSPLRSDTARDTVVVH